MPELVKSSVASFAGTSGLDGTTVWPLSAKYRRNWLRMSLLFMPFSPYRKSAPGSFLVPALDHLQDDVQVEAAALEEAHLARAFRRPTRLPAAELLEPHRTRRLQLALFQLGERRGNAVFRNPLVEQLALDAPRAEAGSPRVHHLLHHSVLGQPAAAFQVVEHALDCCGIGLVRRELAREFRARMLPPREKSQRPLPQAGFTVFPATGHCTQCAAFRASAFDSAFGAGAAGCAAAAPAAARILASISCATFCFSFR